MRQKSAELYKTPTKAEEAMKKLLRDEFRKYGIWFKTSVPMHGYIADFACESPYRKLIIEVDGSFHDGREEYDSRRDKILSINGIKTLRVRNEMVLNEPDKVAAIIKDELNKQMPLKERATTAE